MTKSQLAIVRHLRTKAVFDWDDVRAFDNGAKQWTTRASRNATTAQELQKAKVLLTASPRSRAEYWEAYDTETARMIQELRVYVEVKEWFHVERIAGHLQHRTPKNSPDRAEKDLYVLCAQTPQEIDEQHAVSRTYTMDADEMFQVEKEQTK